MKRSGAPVISGITGAAIFGHCLSIEATVSTAVTVQFVRIGERMMHTVQPGSNALVVWIVVAARYVL